ncbi:unnamed protein product [Calypogeia fissa]
MLRSWGVTKTRSHLPALIKSAGGDVASLPGTAVSPLLVAGQEQAAGIIETIFSSPTHLSKGPSPGRPSPGRPHRVYAEAFPKTLQLLETTAAINSFLMEIPEVATHSSDDAAGPGRQLTTNSISSAIQEYKQRIIVVVVDASRELQLAPLKYALEIVSQPGDKLYVLGILHQVMNPMGYKQKADTTPFNGTSKSMLQEVQRNKLIEFEKSMNEPGLQKLFALKQVNPVVQIATGPDRKVVAARHAFQLHAKWVIIDKHLKNDKAYLMEQLNCNLVLMKPKNKAVMIKVGSPEVQNSPGHHQPTLPLDQSLDLGPGLMTLSPRALYKSVENVVAQRLTEISVSSAAPSVSSSSGPPSLNLSVSSSTSVQQPESPKVSTSQPSAEEHAPEGQSAMTELLSSLPSVSESQADYSDLQEVPSAQSSDHDISPKATSLTKIFRGEDIMAAADPDKGGHDPTDLKGPQEVPPSLEKVVLPEKVVLVNSESDDEAPLIENLPPIKVGSVGNSSSEAKFYKIPGRPSMSTGDLQSLVPKSVPESVAETLFHPAPRSASDRGGEELINILSYTPSSTPSSAGTPKPVRTTLKKSLQEEDLYSQSPTLSTISTISPIGRENKFGSQHDSDNRFLSLDNSAHSRKKSTCRPFAPLCSHCKIPGPRFGSDVTKFSYAELEEATNNFDQENYIAEGGYGFVYRGRLTNGQEIAVKQYKAASSQGDDEFNSEVEVLKHAQHRNLVILVGYCKENEKRLLVYEFVCNKSLDVHLSAKNVNVLEWRWRWKIAVGAARGLRYLHEECRVGCIVHRDMRPNNILLTHDFVPMVGDFGLARSQPSGDEAEETRVIGTLGYLAPEYAESGSITEKADVYSFGVVLLELITGRKAIDATRARGQTVLTEWARPMIRDGRTEDIVDPRLKEEYDVDEVNRMLGVAGLCISKNPDVRPRMSEVLRHLERDGQGDVSLSRGNSFSDLSGDLALARNRSLNQRSRSDHRERSFDSNSLKTISKAGNGKSFLLPGLVYETVPTNSSAQSSAQSQPIPFEDSRRKLRNSKSQIIDRSSSPGRSGKPSSDSPSSGKSAPREKSKAKLFYGNML